MSSLRKNVISWEKSIFLFMCKCIIHPPPPPSLPQSAQRSVYGERAQRTASAATLSVWAAAQSLVVTWHVRRVCITTTKDAAWLTALPAPTSSRAGAASVQSFAPKSTSPTSTASSSTAESACLNAHLVTCVPDTTGEPQSTLMKADMEPLGGGTLIVGLTLVPVPHPAISFHSKIPIGQKLNIIQQLQQRAVSLEETVHPLSLYKPVVVW